MPTPNDTLADRQRNADNLVAIYNAAAELLAVCREPTPDAPNFWNALKALDDAVHKFEAGVVGDEHEPQTG